MMSRCAAAGVMEFEVVWRLQPQPLAPPRPAAQPRLSCIPCPLRPCALPAPQGPRPRMDLPDTRRQPPLAQPSPGRRSAGRAAVQAEAEGDARRKVPGQRRKVRLPWSTALR